MDSLYQLEAPNRGRKGRKTRGWLIGPIMGPFSNSLLPKYLQRLRKDLENVRRLTELSRKRESRKLKQAEIIHQVLSRFLFPHEPPMRSAFEKIMG